MPFDSTPTKLPLTRTQKLERLLYHLSQATDLEQHSFCACLAHRCYVDPVLVDDGLPNQFWSPLGKEAKSEPWYDYFEIPVGHSCYGLLFGGGTVERKTAWVKALLDT